MRVSRALPPEKPEVIATLKGVAEALCSPAHGFDDGSGIPSGCASLTQQPGVALVSLARPPANLFDAFGIKTNVRSSTYPDASTLWGFPHF